MLWGWVPDRRLGPSPSKAALVSVSLFVVDVCLHAGAMLSLYRPVPPLVKMITHFLLAKRTVRLARHSAALPWSLYRKPLVRFAVASRRRKINALLSHV